MYICELFKTYIEYVIDKKDDESEEDVELATDEEDNDMNVTRELDEAENLEKAYNEEIEGDSESIGESDLDSDEDGAKLKKEKVIITAHNVIYANTLN